MNNKNTMCVALMVILTVLCFWSGVMMFYELGKDSFTDIAMIEVVSSGIGEWRARFVERTMMFYEPAKILS